MIINMLKKFRKWVTFTVKLIDLFIRPLFSVIEQWSNAEKASC